MKNKFQVGALAVSVGVFGFAFFACAQTAVPISVPTSSGQQGSLPAQTQRVEQREGQPQQAGRQPQEQKPQVQQPVKPKQPQGQQKETISVDPEGRIIVHGTLASISGNTLTVTAWGMKFTVDFYNAEVIGSVKEISLFATGDFIGVSGMLSASNPGMITADIVNNRSQKPKLELKPESKPLEKKMQNNSSSAVSGGNQQEKRIQPPPLQPVLQNSATTSDAVRGVQQQPVKVKSMVQPVRQ